MRLRSPVLGADKTADTMDPLQHATEAGFPKSARGIGLVFYPARSYSLRKPPRTGRPLIRSWERSAAGWSGRGG